MKKIKTYISSYIILEELYVFRFLILVKISKICVFFYSYSVISGVKKGIIFRVFDVLQGGRVARICTNLVDAAR